MHKARRIEPIHQFEGRFKVLWVQEVVVGEEHDEFGVREIENRL